VKGFWIALALVFPLLINAQGFKVGKLKYDGGGDWYANPSSLPNLFKFIKQNTAAAISLEEEVTELKSGQVFQYPMIYMTGHGNVVFSPSECEMLRKYLLSGGFFHIDDNYGMDKFIRPQLKKLFPANEMVVLPLNHPIFNQKFKLSGLPKIHEHDDKDPVAYAIFVEGKMVCLYTYETDLGDGWEDPQVHNDSAEKHLQALQMGANIIMYAYTN